MSKFRHRFEPGRGVVDGEAQFVLNSFSFLFWGALVTWMCAGFTMLEAGSVRTKNASVVCLKNVVESDRLDDRRSHLARRRGHGARCCRTHAQPEAGEAGKVSRVRIEQRPGRRASGPSTFEWPSVSAEAVGCDGSMFERAAKHPLEVGRTVCSFSGTGRSCWSGTGTTRPRTTSSSAPQPGPSAPLFLLRGVPPRAPRLRAPARPRSPSVEQSPLVANAPRDVCSTQDLRTVER